MPEITCIQQLWGESYKTTLDTITTMYLEEDMSMQEIADELDMTVEVVRTAIIVYRNRF
jgi:predicted DNA-binding protein YlxM (UPF0122 family)